MTTPQDYPSGYPSVPPRQAPPKPAKFGALAWASVILGIVGIVGSPIIFLNNVTAMIAAVGLVLGIIAVFGTKKVLAIIGSGLCVAGIMITVAVQKNMVEEFDELTDEPGSASAGEAGDVADDSDADSDAEDDGSDGHSGPAGWGDRFTWKSGVAVEVAKPADCQPSEFAAPQGIDRAVKFTVTVINDSDESVNTVDLSPIGDAVFDDRKAETVYDSDGDCGDGGMDAVTVRPGKTYSYDVAYAVGSEPGELQVIIDPMLGQEAVFVGTA